MSQRSAAGLRSGDGRGGDRQEDQADVQGAVAVCVLQCEGAQEEAPDQQPGGGQHEEAAGQYRTPSEQADGQQRMAGAALEFGEDRPHGGGKREREDGGRG